MNRKILIFEVTLILAACMAFAISFPHLPASIPMHLNIHMQPDKFGSRWALFWLGPLMMTGFFLLNFLLPWLSPRHFDVEEFRPTFHRLMLILFMLPVYLFVVLLANAFFHIDAGRAIMIGTCLLFTLLGNLMGKVRRNFFIGVRTPWTLASERVWYATHRLAAKTLVSGGIIGMLFAAFGLGPLAITAILAGSFVPVLYSLYYYKKLEKSGLLESSTKSAEAL